MTANRPTPKRPAPVPADPATGARLRGIRVSTGMAPAELADALGLSETDYAAIERGETALPPACLPALARLADAPLATVVADLHGAPETAAELHTLAIAFNAIPTGPQREALLQMAVALMR